MFSPTQLPGLRSIVPVLNIDGGVEFRSSDWGRALLCSLPVLCLMSLTVLCLMSLPVLCVYLSYVWDEKEKFAVRSNFCFDPKTTNL